MTIALPLATRLEALLKISLYITEVTRFRRWRTERLDQVRKELNEIDRHALRESKKPKVRPTKDDYSI